MGLMTRKVGKAYKSPFREDLICLLLSATKQLRRRDLKSTEIQVTANDILGSDLVFWLLLDQQAFVYMRDYTST